MPSSLFLFGLLLFLHTASAFYLPGVIPKEYQTDEVVELKVNKLTSSHSQLPYGFYSLPFCPVDKIIDASESLGEILMGDRIENSAYKLRMGQDFECKLLCTMSYDAKQLALFAEKIKEEYRVHWIVDNLPGATRRYYPGEGNKSKYMYEAGFALGQQNIYYDTAAPTEDEILYINNHVNIKILYHESDQYVGRRIVGFEVDARSIKHNVDNSAKEGDLLDKCESMEPVPQPVNGHGYEEGATISWSYSVSWVLNTEIRWASRWDVYLLMTDDQIHWFSIVNSSMIVLFLSGMVAMIVIRTLHADVARYSEVDLDEDPVEETGWKLVHGDVFRPPAHTMLLSVLVGTGIQVFMMSVVTMLFAILGFLSPSNRGGLLTAMLVLFVVMGIFAGYFAARLYKMFKGTQWKQCIIMTSFLVPGVIFSVFIVLDIALAVEGSSGAVPLTTFLSLVSLWFGVSIPLVIFGSYFGFKKPAIEHPLRTNQIPRQIPVQVCYMRPFCSIMMGGILPFGAIFIELFFILSSVWLHQFYYIFGFLSIVFIILVITCAEITIVMCYFQLCSEDYHWWWRSFLTAGASSVYMFMYSIFYFFTKLQIDRMVSVLLYYGYTFIFTFFFFLLTGCIGFCACFFFVRQIYGSIKVD